LDDNTPVGILLPLGQGLSPDALLRDSTTGILARVRLRPTAILVTANLSPGLSAHLCLELGNLHLPAEVRQDRIIVNDTETNRSLLTRMNVKFEASVDVFIPERTTMLQAVSISPDFTVRRERVV
jgi:urease accessory protein UreE